MTKEDFLKTLSQTTEVSLVGPMLQNHPKKVDHPFIYVDRGTHFKKDIKKHKSGSYAELSVGDGDSSTLSLDINLPRDKDFSDLKFALELLPSHIEKVNLWGFLGGRLDHEFINFGEVHHALLHGLPNALFSFEEKVLAKKNGPIKLEIHGTFSLIVFQKTKLKIGGQCRYPLKTFTEVTPLSSLGLSNLGEGEVTIEANGPFFIFLE